MTKYTNEFFLQMKPREYDAFMFKRFKCIFREHKLPMSQTCMCWGCEIGPGWRLLVYELCLKLEMLEKRLGVKVVATQVKGKYASLRFYASPRLNSYIFRLANRLRFTWLYNRYKKQFDTTFDIVDAVIDQAEVKSTQTCEECGAYGWQRNGGWLYIACDQHAREGTEEK